MTIKPDFLFKLSEQPGLLTIEELITIRATEDLENLGEAYKNFDEKVMEVFDTKNGKFSQQYESVGHIRVKDAVKKFG